MESLPVVTVLVLISFLGAAGVSGFLLARGHRWMAVLGLLIAQLPARWYIVDDGIVNHRQWGSPIVEGVDI
jgi:hypothetical protein